MRGLCDARGCQERARWYAVAVGPEKKVAFNVSSCDEHRKLTVAEVAASAGLRELVVSLAAFLGAGAEVGWEHIGGT